MTLAKLQMVATYLKGQEIGSAAALSNLDRRISVGPILLDRALGGGLRVGWVTSFYGVKSGGKTTTAMRSVASAQGLCRNCYRPAKNVTAVSPPPEVLAEDPKARWSASGECDCYATGVYRVEKPSKDSGESQAQFKTRVAEWEAGMLANSYEELVAAWMDSEGTFDSKWASSPGIGVDCNRLLYVRPENAEEVIDIIQALIGTIQLDFMVIDSIAQLTPSTELNESSEKWQQGLQARLVNKYVRKAVSTSHKVARANRSITQIWINQVRDKIGVMFGDPSTKPGGKGQEFAVCAEVKFLKSKPTHHDEQYGSKDDTIGTVISERINFTVTKEKTGGRTLGVSGHYIQQLVKNDAGPVGRIVDEEELFKLAMHYLVEQKKDGYYLGELKFGSQKELMALLRSDKDLFVAVRRAVLDRLLDHNQDLSPAKS